MRFLFEAMKKFTLRPIRFFALVFAILYTLSSCTADDQVMDDQKIVVGNKYGHYFTGIVMSAEIKTKQVKQGETAEIDVGFGQMYQVFIYEKATFRIHAPNMKILLSDDTSFEQTYESTMENFDQYGYDKENSLPSHIESFRFVYTGEKGSHTGTIAFSLFDMMPDVCEMAVIIYYTIDGEKISFSTRAPESLE